MVAVLAEPVGYRDKLIVIRRKSGKLGLPGGFHMRGETWQEAGIRELYEETGYTIAAGCSLAQFKSTVTDEYGHNMIFALPEGRCSRDPFAVLDGEALEVLVTDPLIWDESDWEFPLHYQMAMSWAFL